MKLICLLKSIFIDITPDGWISLIGAILGAIATIVSVRLTIKYEKDKEDTERILLFKPWLTSDNELINNRLDLFKRSTSDILYVFKNGNSFGTSRKIPSQLEKEDFKYNENCCILYYSFLNSGGNTATMLTVKMNGQDILPPFCLSTIKEQNWMLVLPKNTCEKETQYTLTFCFGDIVSNTRYVQKETFVVSQTSTGLAITQNIQDLMTIPKKIGEKR